MPDLIVYSYKQAVGMRLPFVTFAIQNAQRWFAVEAYVDSGAVYSVFTPALHPAWAWNSAAVVAR